MEGPAPHGSMDEGRGTGGHPFRPRSTGSRCRRRAGSQQAAGTPGGVPVRNVAMPLMGEPYRVFTLGTG